MLIHNLTMPEIAYCLTNQELGGLVTILFENYDMDKIQREFESLVSQYVDKGVRENVYFERLDMVYDTVSMKLTDQLDIIKNLAFMDAMINKNFQTPYINYADTFNEGRKWAEDNMPAYLKESRESHDAGYESVKEQYDEALSVMFPHFNNGTAFSKAAIDLMNNPNKTTDDLKEMF